MGNLTPKVQRRGIGPERRASVIATVLEGLHKGTPLTVLCKAEGMPGYSTVRDWIDADSALAGDIARAREAGFDAIALDALAIADHSLLDTTVDENGIEKQNSEWVARSRLRVDTRLKLLAKWDPKRYGELLKIGDTDGNKFELGIMMAERRAKVISGRES